MDRYPYPTSPRSRPTKIRRYRLGAVCIIIFGVRGSSATTVCYELLWYPNTYDFTRGLALSNHSSSLSAAMVEQSEGESFPSWTLRPPRLGRPSFSCLPQSVGEHLLLLLPRLRGKSVLQSHRMVSPTMPGVGNSFGFPWPSWSSPHLVRSRSQHLRQESIRNVFGQRGRTVNLPRHLHPILSKAWRSDPAHG